jgi:hypothetical protein
MIRYLTIAFAIFVLSAPAQAECLDAIGAQIQASVDEKTAYALDLQTTLGPNTEFNFNSFDNCAVMTPVAKRRLPFVERVIAADGDYHASCPELLDDDAEETEIDSYPATEMRAILVEYIAVCSSKGD